MKFVMEPTLEHMALVKIGVSLWNQNDVRTLISKLNYKRLIPSEWKVIEESVIEKVPQLSLPQQLKEKVFGVIKPIGMQIFEWMNYYGKYDTFEHDVDIDLPAYLPAELCWTPQGTVDRKRTAEVIVGDESLDISTRYCLACDYILEDDIIRFWNRLVEEIKDYVCIYMKYINFPVVSFWTNAMIGVASQTYYKNEFYLSVRDSNKVAAKYFLQKLTPQEREECLKKLTIYLKDADVLCFLLPEMTEEEQMLVFKREEQNEDFIKMPYRVLQCFLHWPWQSFFMGVANRMWDFLSKEDYDKIFRAIIGKVREGYKDYNYQKLFREFWQKSPSALKDSVTEAFLKSWLTLLFDIEDKENIRLILKDATLAAKEKLIYSDEIKHSCERSIRGNEWYFLEFFIRECLPSKNEMLKFKVEFEKSVMHSNIKEHFTTKKQEWDQLFRFSDVSICKYCKRSVEEGESSSSKRFQSLQ